MKTVLPEIDFQKSSGIGKTKDRMLFCMPMYVCGLEAIRQRYALLVIISLPDLI